MIYLAITLIISIILIFGNIADFVKISNAVHNQKVTYNTIRDMIRDSFFFEPISYDGNCNAACDDQVDNLYLTFWRNNLLSIVPILNVVCLVGWVIVFVKKHKSSSQKRLSDAYESKIYGDDLE